MSLAIIFNGQGAHYKGMGLDFVKAYPEAEQTFDQAEQITGYPLRKWLADDIAPLAQTQYAQVAIAATSLAIYHSIQAELPDISHMAGLSLGEYTSLIAGELLGFEEGMKLIQKRGQLMTSHCETLREESDIVMEAVMKMPLDEVRTVLAEINESAEKVFLANINSSTQITIAGTTEAVDEFKLLAKERGYKRMMPLKVEGPFHTPYMAPVAEPFQEALEEVTFQEPTIPIISNTTVQPHNVVDIRDWLTRHLTESVRWQETMDHFMSKGVDKVIQIGPGKTLANLLKRETNASEILVLDKIDDLEKLADFIGG